MITWVDAALPNGAGTVSSDRHKEIVRRGYDALSERYRADEDTPAGYEGWLHALTARLPLAADVLDLGCGCGVPMARWVAELGHDVIGVDISRTQIDEPHPMVDALRRRCARPALRRRQSIHGPAG
jgi:hypothetical protein